MDVQRRCLHDNDEEDDENEDEDVNKDDDVDELFDDEGGCNNQLGGRKSEFYPIKRLLVYC